MLTCLKSIICHLLYGFSHFMDLIFICGKDKEKPNLELHSEPLITIQTVIFFAS